jgi:hypothetical protein
MIQTWEDIPGFFDFHDIYDQAVEEAGPEEIFVEVGTFLGKSAAYLATKILESRKELALFVVDSWDDKEYAQWWIDIRKNPAAPWPVEELYGMPLFSAFKHCIYSVGLQGQISPMRQKSAEASGNFEDGSLFFVFIDANHLYEGIALDIYAWKKKVKPGGILAGHDYGVRAWPDVKRAVDEVFGSRVEHRNNSWLVRM